MWFYIFTLLISIHCSWFGVSPFYLMKFLHCESLLFLVSARTYSSKDTCKEIDVPEKTALDPSSQVSHQGKLWSIHFN